MPASFEIISPIDGTVYATLPFTDADAAAAACARAREAQRAWHRRPLADRIAVCMAFLDKIKAETGELSAELASQMGRPASQGKGEVGGVVERTTHMAKIAEQSLADVVTRDDGDFDCWISREPLGVVLVIAPWNYPYLTAINAIMPSLIAGNAVILKHAAQTALCGDRLARLFNEAGLPDDLLISMHMTHDTVAKLVDSPLIDHVVLTGSVGAGRAVQRAAAGRFIGVATELGGKDPAYVRADADLAFTVPNVVDGAFFNSGQSCCAIERVYVHESIFADFVEAFVAETKNYRLGNPLDETSNLGPMVSATAAASVRVQIEDAIDAGARSLIAGNHFAADTGNGAYLAPTVLVDVDHSMAIMTEETFGPAIGIMAVKDDAEAIRLMNDSNYGLTASIWTKDVDAVRAIDAEIETGTVFMNRADYLDPALPWVGVKDTGRGCSLSALCYLALTRPKSHHYRLVKS